MSKFYEAVGKMDPQLMDPSISTPAAEPPPPVQPEAAPKREDPPPANGSRRLAAVAVSRQISVAISAGSPVLPFDGADDMAAERYRIIRTKLLHDPRRPGVLCVSSSGMGDGKSVNAINIAGALALKEDFRVLLVDSDFRRSTLARMLGAPEAPGLSEVLAGAAPWQDAIHQIAEAPNLYFLPAGQYTASPAELLDTARWKSVCETFRTYFNFVLIDSPPIGIVADYDLIQSVCDGVILVARQDHSDRNRLLKAIESVPREKLIGVVMNCVTPWALWKAADDYPKGAAYGYKPAGKGRSRPSGAEDYGD